MFSEEEKIKVFKKAAAVRDSAWRIARMVDSSEAWAFEEIYEEIDEARDTLEKIGQFITKKELED